MEHKIATAFVTGGSGFLGRELIRLLASRGVAVRALARSDVAETAVRDAGATPVRGDVADPIDPEHLRGCDTVFHAAAKVEIDGPLAEHERVSVGGTRNILAAATAAKVPCLVYVSSEQAILGGPSMINADETTPYPPTPLGPYATTKAACEKLLRAVPPPGAEGGGPRCVIVRPRLIWGRGDTVIAPAIAAAVKQGKFRWFRSGAYDTSTCHVRNVCAGLVAAAERGGHAEVYFVTDGAPVNFKRFMSTYVPAMTGVDMSRVGNAPAWVASLAAMLGLAPKAALRVLFETCTVSDAKARRDLGYSPPVTMEEGMREVGATWPPATAASP